MHDDHVYGYIFVSENVKNFIELTWTTVDVVEEDENDEI